MNPVAPLKILKASAGSGKTFSLTLHYINLLLIDENNYREILAVTFTNKATAEMKERILSVLQGLATGDKQPKIDSFRKLLLEQHYYWKTDDLLEKAKRVYRRILHDYGRFTISTIDGFSQKVIRSFTYELNLDAAYKVEMNTAKVKQDLSIMLNQMLDERPDLLEWIIAFAEQKIANNENWNYRKQLLNLAGLIFTENFQEFNAAISATDDKKIFHLLHSEVQEQTKTFLDSLSLAIQTYIDCIKSFQLGNEDLKGKSRNKLLVASRISPNIQKESPSSLQKIFERFTDLQTHEDSYIDSDKNQRDDIRYAVAPILQQIAELQQYFSAYIAYQAVQNNLYYLRLLKEMSDLLSLWRKENGAQLISDSQILLNKLGLDHNNDPTFIWEKIGNRYNYFLFDEFQDTSRIQWKNYSPLLINALGNAQQKTHEHLIVGDVKQSIYRWRNGDWRILLQQVEEQIATAFHLQPQQRQQFIENGTLETNYRSLPNIISFNNYLFKEIPHILQRVLNEKVRESLDGDAWDWWNTSGNDRMLLKAYEKSEQQIPEHKQFSESFSGSIEIDYFPVTDGRFRSNKVQAESLAALCHKVAEWLNSGRYKAGQIGILVRSNAQAKMVIEQLMLYKNETGLNFNVISGDALSLAANEAIQLLVETLKAFVYQSDQHIIYRAKMAYLYQLINQGESFPPNEWLNFKSNRINDLSALLPADLLMQWSELQRSPLIHLIEQLIEIYGLQQKNNIHLPYILAFKDMVSNFSTQGDRGLNQFIQYWEEDGHKASLPASTHIDAIEVTTIHKSKGLAYDVVMIPFCSWTLDSMLNGDFWIDTTDSPFAQLGKIPIKYNSTVGQSIFYKQYFEEMLFNYMDSLNTFYVATTRAIQHLYITAPGFTEQVDKKTGAITGYAIKNDYISDILYQVLDKEDTPFALTANSLKIDPTSNQAQTFDKNLSEASNETIITLEQYPLSNELKNAFDSTAKRSINNIMQLEKAAQYGLLAHEIISEVSREDEILTSIDSYIEQGILGKEERSLLLEEIMRIWRHPQINKWLSGSYKIWNEASIILADGQTIRPDKVFTAAEETIVLDFKFTKGDYADHKWQVDSYKKALQNLGYQQVKGYLYYAKFNELVEVK
ncbi:UvrD-helicase domain-containing protein [Sphingobacterium sp. UT-1RO-CII-1]|uniref:UvrD-helicase domain-containing protein n=1 Tax=Sphingobacterium sp. UT-1RO-CII-1 TaxID=2995225 RepID=UPI00227AFC20|nr:UvrD-helicase domain-containing protein [Sphingobacterium sp. UT-1RO-CII-1]MCY4781058.1 UvrD-helicase domain-containing protein [Sphingobacterium sp. UT-1RO-CII-1]